MTGARVARRKQRIADVFGMFLAIFVSLSLDDRALWQRLVVVCAIAVGASVLARYALRVPIWHTQPDETPPHLPPYGSPPVA